METKICPVKDIEACDKQVLEHLLGLSLHDDQQVVIQVMKAGQESEGPLEENGDSTQLPEWCNVYEGLSLIEIEDLEKVILNRCDLNRSAD
jgi:hypothetical protein